MYQCKHFKITELVYPEIYNQYKNNQRLLWLAFDDRLLMTLDLLREKYGSITINNWNAGGPRKESALRNMSTTTGAALSQHKFGRAADLIFSKITAEQVRQEMKKEGCFEKGYFDTEVAKTSPFRMIHAVEWLEKGKPISWFHFDIRNDSVHVDRCIKIINV